MGEMDEDEQEVSFGKNYAGNPGDQTGGISGGKGGPNKGSSKAPVPNKGSSKAPVPAKPQPANPQPANPQPGPSHGKTPRQPIASKNLRKVAQTNNLIRAN